MLMYVSMSEPCLDHTIPSGWTVQICGQWLCSWANMIIACIIHASPCLAHIVTCQSVMGMSTAAGADCLYWQEAGAEQASMHMP